MLVSQQGLLLFRSNNYMPTEVRHNAFVSQSPAGNGPVSYYNTSDKFVNFH